ncbi:MAG: hypothetical protein Q7V15_09045 [Phenylobacterium sp.]|uniref:hypothetical protein n=1 Tax=Phenylobacterium sp. TaxID=1871053 RepID=UPI002718E9B1|nr:hypothetical protein [Phenylobacterium sp.]MDO8901487.1 hypothetical protein [Phenylobacterium sp.]
MTIQRDKARRRVSRWMGTMAAAGVLATPLTAVAGPLDLYVERTAMAAADQRCGFFDSGLRAALEAGRIQTRNAALRSGATADDLSRADARARASARTVICDSEAVSAAAAHVRSAFDGFAKLRQITYPGETADWRADRTSSAQIHRWRLAQQTDFAGGQMVFGLAGRDTRPVLLALASFADGRTPYAARLIMRDETRAARPYLDLRGDLDLARRMPPAGALRTYSAEARSKAGLDLRPEAMGAGWAFRFPTEAAVRLTALDPREAVAVEFLFSQGPAVRRVYVEVGDFAVGHAFLAMASR